MAYSDAHYWKRQCLGIGYASPLMTAQLSKPLQTSQLSKSNRDDAKVIATVAHQDNMRLVQTSMAIGRRDWRGIERDVILHRRN
jgi:hypothetical protein